MATLRTPPQEAFTWQQSSNQQIATMNHKFPRAINVTRPILPPLSQLLPRIEQIYHSGIVTNMGPIHQELEFELQEILGGQDLVLFNNGTTALIAALDAMNLPPGSEVITTPFSFAATTHAISSLGLKPVFADIEPNHMTLDPAAVVKKITDKTRCILAVHVYGFPCDVEGLQRLSIDHGVRLVYDAAHAFGTTLWDQPISKFGDASVFSFHATKLFNTIEGGAVSSNRDQAGRRMRSYRNFGIKSEDIVDEIGLNGKMSEFHALIGLLNLEYYSAEVKQRKIVREAYVQELSDVTGIEIPSYAPGVGGSYQYFPIRIPGLRDTVYNDLKAYNIFTRRYFYPLIADFEPYRDFPSASGLPEARRAARDVLCLPFYGDLADGTALRIAELVRSTIRHHSR